MCIGVGFVFVFGFFAWVLVRGFAQWTKNNASPVESGPARVAAKRTDTSGMSGGRVWTSYYVAFELGSGERREFEVEGEEYGVLVEGDRGSLTHQGTRYKGFARAA